MAGEISTFFGNDVGAIVLETGSKGDFEVWANDQQVYSKRQTGKFPDWLEVKDLLRPHAPAKV